MASTKIQPCLNCGKKLFRMNLLPGGSGAWAMDPTDRLEPVSEGDDRYYECPACGARNHLRASEHEGLPQEEIFRFTLQE